MASTPEESKHTTQTNAPNADYIYRLVLAIPGGPISLGPLYDTGYAAGLAEGRAQASALEVACRRYKTMLAAMTKSRPFPTQEQADELTASLVAMDEALRQLEKP